MGERGVPLSRLKFGADVHEQPDAGGAVTYVGIRLDFFMVGRERHGKVDALHRLGV